MASINKVLLMGHLGADPETRDANGTLIANLSLATSHKYKDRNGQQVEETEWHRVVLFGRTAEIAQEWLKKGSCIFVEGRLRTRQYEDRQGQKRFTTEIVGENMQFVNGNRDGQQSHQQSQPAAARQQQSFDDVPF